MAMDRKSTLLNDVFPESHEKDNSIHNLMIVILFSLGLLYLMYL